MIIQELCYYCKKLKKKTMNGVTMHNSLERVWGIKKTLNSTNVSSKNSRLKLLSISYYSSVSLSYSKLHAWQAERQYDLYVSPLRPALKK